jgi:hypothetical protein
VPPPPVCGAPVMTGVGDTVALGVAAAVRIAVAVGRTVTVGATVTARVARAEPGPLDVGWTEPLGVGKTELPAVATAVGTNVVADTSGGDDDVHPDTAAVPRTAMAPMPTTAGSARGVRTLFRYPPEQR